MVTAAQSLNLNTENQIDAHHPHLIKDFLLALGILALANGLLFGAPRMVQAVYHNRILPLISIDGVSVGGQTLDEARRIVQANRSLSGRLVIIRFGETKKQIAVSDLGVQEDFTAELAEAYATGRTQPYRGNRTVSRKYQLNETRLQEAITQMFGQQPEEAKNAQLHIQDGQVTALTAISKKSFDWQNIERQVLAQFSQPIVTLKLTVVDTPPAITETDLTEVKNQLERMLASTVSIADGSTQIMVPRKIIGDWIDIHQDRLPAEVSFDDNKMQGYINQIASNFEQKAITEIVLDDGSVEQTGVPGQQINRGQAVVDIKRVLAGQASESKIQLVFTEVPFGRKVKSRGYTAGLFAGRYIEVNLSEQKMYLFEGESLMNTFPVSTGKWSMPTPEGEFSINSKVDVAYSHRYNLYMPKWMAFVGSQYGIHGLPYWANGYVEGENHLGRPVSHGCIRLSHADADTAYNWADVGTKVYIHK